MNRRRGHKIFSKCIELYFRIERRYEEGRYRVLQLNKGERTPYVTTEDLFEFEYDSDPQNFETSLKAWKELLSSWNFRNLRDDILLDALHAKQEGRDPRHHRYINETLYNWRKVYDKLVINCPRFLKFFNAPPNFIKEN